MIVENVANKTNNNYNNSAIESRIAILIYLNTPASRSMPSLPEINQCNENKYR